MPILAKCISKFPGNTLEFGIGNGSSPLLNLMVDQSLLSFESNKEWYDRMLSGSEGKKLWTKPGHYVNFVPDNNWDWIYSVVDWTKHWSLAFIDHAPGERRIIDIARLADKVDVIIYHDSEEPSYGWKQIDGLFKSKYVYDTFVTNTTVVSNKYDLSTIL